MPQIATEQSARLVLVGKQNGIVVISSQTPLTRLNYFDGKFLRAADLTAEQRYLRSLVQVSNQAGGHGIAYGYDVSKSSSGTVQVSAGLAIDAEGRVVLSPSSVTLTLQELIDKSRQATLQSFSQPVVGSIGFADCVIATDVPGGTLLLSDDLFVITVAQAEALCGEEDVYGKLCEEACVTSTDRPFRVEGVIFCARPLQLLVPLPVSAVVALSGAHLRSRVASAYYATERLAIANHISKTGLESDVWCFGADADSGSEVPIAVVARAGTSIQYLDAWTVRRERIDTPAKRYWQWRMAMRPWDVFLAQVLQFQCQLRDCLKETPGGGTPNPCEPERSLIGEVSNTLTSVTAFYEQIASRLATIGAGNLLPGGLAGLRAIGMKVLDAKNGFGQTSQERLLINCGIIETPSAGYLPVVPSADLTVNQQVRRMMGEGVDLRFCVVRPDYVAHALEEAQHMERISLLQGLDHTEDKPQVDVLVPNGEILTQERKSPGTGFEALVQFGTALVPGGPTRGTKLNSAAVNLQGAARAARLPTGGGAVYLGAVTRTSDFVRVVRLASGLAGVGRADAANVDRLRDLSTSTDPAPSESIATRPGLLSGVNAVAAEALRFRASRLATRPVFGEPAGPRPVGIFNPPQNTPERVAAAWIAASTVRNPFAMQVGDSTPVELRFVLVLPSNTPTIFNFEIRGTFVLGQPPLVSGGNATLNGTVSALLSLERTDEGQEQPPVNQSVKFQATATLGGGELKVTLRESESRFSFELLSTLSGDPRKARTRIVYKLDISDRPVEIELADSLLTQNSAVLSAGNASHTAALSALDVIGAALDDTEFADTAARQLFPPPPAPDEELLVRATLDWVLFHRRRTKVCADMNVPAVAGARRYQMLHLRATDLEYVRAVRQALLNNDTAFLAAAGFQSIDVAEFGAGVATLLTPVADIQADWSAAQPGNTLIYGAVASQGAAVQDGNALAVARLSRLEGAVSSVSIPSPNLQNDTLSVVPAPLAAVGTDGVMVLITLEVQNRTTCHLVFRTVQPVTRVVSIIQTEGVAGAVQRGWITQLAAVQFPEGSAEIAGDGAQRVKGAWDAQGGGTIGAAAAISLASDTSIPPDRRTAQATAIRTAIGPGPNPTLFPTQVALGVDCTTVTIIEAVATPVPFGFNAQAETPPVVRPEGVTELVADYLLTGTGGTAGQNVTANFQYFMNTELTNQATAIPVLLINDPAPDEVVEGVNLFRGMRPAGTQNNTVVFTGVRFQFPGSGQVVLRIDGVRANAAAIGPGTQIFAFIEISSAEPIPVTNPQHVVALVSQSGAPAPPTPAPTVPRTGRIFVTEGNDPNRRIVSRRVTTVTFAADGSIDTGLTDAMVADLQSFGTLIAMEFATQEPAPDTLADARIRALTADLRRRGLAGNLRSGGARALTDADRQILPGTASTANDIIFLQRG